ncbi:DUF6054 family protein [Paludicola sp. MB14-C6]|uniref:DUF6054 family protein n=1 Tax=Paludihabitans sp. MB14-C6 TaxID=3070656 RepID=UPI0027DCC0D8|nr:DUF6054 family protein [Paludicola sp. MB14-C6]WMJ24083.1 DUF6054 family protein [Paludicola sp. MB14-C6]
MARIMMKGNANVDDIALLLKTEIKSSGHSCELIDMVERKYGELTMHVMVFERFYTRNMNRASLTLVVTGNPYTTIVDAICTIAGKGSLINFSWGAEEDFICIVQQILSNQGFQQASQE